MFHNQSTLKAGRICQIINAQTRKSFRKLFDIC